MGATLNLKAFVFYTLISIIITLNTVHTRVLYMRVLYIYTVHSKTFLLCVAPTVLNIHYIKEGVKKKFGKSMVFCQTGGRGVKKKLHGVFFNCPSPISVP